MRSWSKMLRASLFLFLLCLHLEAARFSNCEWLWRKLAKPGQDSSVEIEIPAFDPILNLLTTRDGKVNGILSENPPPKEFSDLHPGLTDVELRSLSWEDLPIEEKRILLQYVSNKKKTTFFEDRGVPNVRIRDNVAITFRKPTEFLGKTYPAGTHTINLAAVMNKVEYMGTTNNPNYFELHFRTANSSGTTSLDAWKLLDALGVPRTHQHIHIVSKLPMEELKENPEVTGAMLGDFYRRANLVAEMISIVDEGSSIKRNANWKAVFFDHMSDKMLRGVTQYFTSVGKGINFHLGDSYKMGWVGFRGSDKYDQPNLFGFEYRAIPSGGNEKTYREVLDTIQWALQQKEYGIPKAQMEKWLQQHPNKASPDAVANSWYDRPWGSLFKEAHPELKNKLGFIKRLILRYRGMSGQELKMLVHDWTKDPLFFDNPQMQERILKNQKEAIEKINLGANTHDIVTGFLSSSGLYEGFSQSLGYQSQ